MYFPAVAPPEAKAGEEGRRRLAAAAAEEMREMEDRREMDEGKGAAGTRAEADSSRQARHRALRREGRNECVSSVVAGKGESGENGEGAAQAGQLQSGSEKRVQGTHVAIAGQQCLLWRES